MPCDITMFSHRAEPGSWAAWWMTVFKLLCVCCIVCVLQYVLQCAFWNFFSVSSFVRNRVITLIFDIVFFQVWTKVFKAGTARLSDVFDCWTPSRHGLDWYTSTSPVLSMSWPGSIPCDTDTCGQTPWMCWSTCLPPTIVCGKLSKAPGASPPWHTRVVSPRVKGPASRRRACRVMAQVLISAESVGSERSQQSRAHCQESCASRCHPSLPCQICTWSNEVKTSRTMIHHQPWHDLTHPQAWA